MSRLALLLVCACVAAVHAARVGADDGGTPTLTSEQRDILANARQLIEAGAAAQSIAEVRALLPTVQDRPYAQAMAQVVLGSAQAHSGDLAGAAQAFGQALASGLLPAALRHDTQYQFAYVLLRQGRNVEARALLEQWLNGEAHPSPDARRLAALAFTRAGRCDLAVPQLEALSAAGGGLDGGWAQALRGCRSDLKHRGSTTALVLGLLRDHPNDKRIWLQGVGMYRDAGQSREALALLEILAQRAQLDGGELLELAQLYLAAGTPLRAATLLEDSIAKGQLPKVRANLERLAQAWRAGHEYQRAIESYRGIVSEQADGNLYFAIGELAFDLGHWRDAIEALQAALRQPVLKHVAAAQLLLGIAAFENADQDLARSALSVARKATETQASAEWWLQELTRRAAREGG